jgi:hypothetical protein
MCASYALRIVDALSRSIYSALLSTTMKYSTQSTESSLEKDFGPDRYNRLSTIVISTPELVPIEQEA